MLKQEEHWFFSGLLLGIQGSIGLRDKEGEKQGVEIEEILHELRDLSICTVRQWVFYLFCMSLFSIEVDLKTSHQKHPSESKGIASPLITPKATESSCVATSSLSREAERKDQGQLKFSDLRCLISKSARRQNQNNSNSSDKTSDQTSQFPNISGFF